MNDLSILSCETENWIHIQATDVFEIRTFWFVNTFWNKCWKNMRIEKKNDWKWWQQLMPNRNFDISIDSVSSQCHNSHQPIFAYFILNIYWKQIQRARLFSVWLIDAKFEFRVNGFRWTKRCAIVNYLPYAITLSPKIHIQKCIVEKLNVFTILLIAVDCRLST